MEQRSPGAVLPMPSAPRARAVLIIEDEPQIRRALRGALRDVTERVLEASTGAEGVDLAAAEQPDLIVLDLGLPDQPGLEVCREIRSWARMPIVVLSARHSEPEKVQLLNAGADDYITKPFGMYEFEARVRAQLRRAATSLGPTLEVIRVEHVMIDPARRRVERGGEPVHLTPIEWKILRALISEGGRTLTHQQIFERVWGKAFGNPQQYLRVHITNLRRKIEPDPANPVLVVTEPGVGYRFEPVS